MRFGPAWCSRGLGLYLIAEKPVSGPGSETLEDELDRPALAGHVTDEGDSKELQPGRQCKL
jgi:hypothetical protein